MVKEVKTVKVWREGGSEHPWFDNKVTRGAEKLAAREGVE